MIVSVINLIFNYYKFSEKDQKNKLQGLLLDICFECQSRTIFGNPYKIKSCIKHYCMVGRSYGDHLTIFYTSRTMFSGACFNLSFKDNFGGLFFQLEKSNYLALSHFYRKCIGGSPSVERSICICSSSVLEGNKGVPV